MKKAHIVLSSSLISLSASMPLLAEESATPLSWNAAAELGFVKTSGNSKTDTLNAKLDGSTSYNKWKHSFHFETLNSSSNDIRSAEKYLVIEQSNLAINDRSYLLDVVTWEKDNFSGFDSQASFALGYGYKVLNSDNINLDFEVAPGYRVNKLVSGNDEEDGILRLAENFSWKVSSTSTLDQYFSSEVGDSNTISRFGVSLTSQVAGDLSMKVGYALKRNSDVPVGTNKTDVETSMTLVYKI